MYKAQHAYMTHDISTDLKGMLSTHTQRLAEPRDSCKLSSKIDTVTDMQVATMDASTHALQCLMTISVCISMIRLHRAANTLCFETSRPWRLCCNSSSSGSSQVSHAGSHPPHPRQTHLLEKEAVKVV
jgi:hypothetical protein